ncbi:lectin [Flindersiella endophytica]
MRALEGEEERAGPYILLAELGAGGMGRVYLASGPDGSLVAVKRIEPRYVDDEGFRARFAREVDACRRVSGAYTAAVVAADPEATRPWLASVFVPGPSLAETLEAFGPLPEQAVLHLAARLATALGDIHRAGLVHRDLKPSNVLLAEDGLRVIDFGIVRAVQSSGEQTLTTLPLGSPAYMSPEQAQAQPVTTASDLFSLGTLLTVASTGRNPFHVAGNLEASLRNIVRAQPDLTGVPARLRPIVERCLAKDPAARPTPAQMLSLLGKIPPTSRPWPGAIYDRIAQRRTEVDRLLDGSPEPTQAMPAGPPSASPGPGQGPSFEPVTKADPAQGRAQPQGQPSGRPPAKRSPWLAMGAVALVLAVVVLIGVAWRLMSDATDPSDGDTTTQETPNDSASESSTETEPDDSNDLDTPPPPIPVTGTIVGAEDMCLDADQASSDNGTAAIIHTCNGGANQQWTLAQDGSIRTLGKCLDVIDANPANGTRVQLWDCHAGPNQQWTAQDGHLVDKNSGRCLDIPIKDIVDGTQVQIWDCGTGDNQQWQLPD